MESKQELADQIAALAGVPACRLSAGGTEPIKLFIDVIGVLGIEVSDQRRKPELAKLIVESAGGKWDGTCDSRGSESGGGSTVTAEGLRRVRDAVALLRESQAVVSDADEPSAIDVSPGIDSLLSYRNHGYEIWYAIAELVDNSVASYRIAVRDGLIDSTSKRLRVIVDFDSVEHSISISDNAAGITGARLQTALIAGRRPTDRTDLNQFGMGLKTASFWFGSRLELETRPIDADQSIVVVMDLLEMVRAGQSTVTPVVSPSRSGHGTSIRLLKLWPERSLPRTKTLGKIRDYLASIYRREIADGLLELEVAGRILEAPSHSVLVAPRWDDPGGVELEWKKSIAFNVDGKDVRGEVWLLEKGDTANAGLVLSWRGKAIVGAGAGANDSNDSYRPARVFGRSNSFVSQRLMGELDVSSFSVTTRKDGLEWSEDVRDQFAEELRAALDSEPLPLIKMATMYRKNNSPVEIVSDVESTGTALVASLSELSFEEFNELDISAIDTNSHAETPIEGGVRVGVEESDVAVTTEFELPIAIPGIASAQLRFDWDPDEFRTVWWVRGADDRIVIHANRASQYLENFAGVPEFRLEPIARLLVALVLAEIQATAEGLRSASRVVQLLNERLANSLGRPVVERGDTNDS